MRIVRKQNTQNRNISPFDMFEMMMFFIDVGDLGEVGCLGIDCPVGNTWT